MRGLPKDSCPILLVEDNPLDAYLIQEAVSEADGMQPALVHVERLSDALQRLTQGNVAVVLLDLFLPDSAGLNTIRQVCTTAPTVPIVVLTGLADESLALEAMRAGAQDYLVKGQVDGPVLSGAIRYAIERQRMVAALAKRSQELQVSEERYRSLFEESYDAIYSVSGSGQFLDVNPAAVALLGYTRDAYRRLNVRDLCVDPEAPGHLHRTIVQQGFVKDYDVQLRRQDGAIVDCLVTATARRHGAAQIAGYHGVCRDVTTQKRLGVQLRQTQKMEAIGTLAGGIAHDFNNILCAILGYTELAISDAPSQSPVLRHLREVLVASNRARDLVQQILTFSRQSEQNYRPMRLQPIVKEVMLLLRASLPATIEIRSELDADAGVVLANATQIHQVLLNLCTNAAQAMRKHGGLLVVRLEAVPVPQDVVTPRPDLQAGPHVCLTVSDTGEGIQPEILERIFEPFFTTKASGEGTGMGLAVVHGIAAEHGGKMNVQSTPGKGTIFRLYLPCTTQPIPPESTSEAPIGGGRARILLVDDEATLAGLSRETLERLGHQVTCHISSIEALEAFQTSPQNFDLVITDQTMPHLTGEALARELRRVRPEIPIILCTGFGHGMNLEKSQALRIDAFLMKPFNIRELALTIQKVMKRPQAS